MLRGLYTAGSALQSAMLNQELVADNLANATTPGYRKQGMTFESLVSSAGASDQPSGTPGSGGTGYTSFEPGPLQPTGNPFDLALSGNVFFVLEGPNGPVYTRNGVFELNAQGELQTRSGLRVRGQGARLTIPADAPHVRITVDGGVLANGVEVGRLELATFDRPQELRRAGNTLFEGPAPRTPDPGSFRVEQGYREGSNVQMVQEMVTMMVGMRQYEAAERALRSLGEAVGNNTRPQGA